MKNLAFPQANLIIVGLRGETATRQENPNGRIRARQDRDPPRQWSRRASRSARGQWSGAALRDRVNVGGGDRLIDDEKVRRGRSKTDHRANDQRWNERAGVLDDQ